MVTISIIQGDRSACVGNVDLFVANIGHLKWLIQSSYTLNNIPREKQALFVDDKLLTDDSELLEAAGVKDGTEVKLVQTGEEEGDGQRVTRQKTSHESTPASAPTVTAEANKTLIFRSHFSEQRILFRYAAGTKTWFDVMKIFRKRLQIKSPHNDQLFFYVECNGVNVEVGKFLDGLTDITPTARLDYIADPQVIHVSLQKSNSLDLSTFSGKVKVALPIIEIEGLSPDTLVVNIKKSIFEQTNIAVDEQRLTLDSQVLRDDAPLSTYGSLAHHVTLTFERVTIMLIS